MAVGGLSDAPDSPVNDCASGLVEGEYRHFLAVGLGLRIASIISWA